MAKYSTEEICYYDTIADLLTDAAVVNGSIVKHYDQDTDMLYVFNYKQGDEVMSDVSTVCIKNASTKFKVSDILVRCDVS